MPSPLLISLAGLSLAAAALGVYWGVVLIHVARTALRQPTADDGLTPDAPLAGPSVCVVVPAHNERACIDRVARSILKQTYRDLAAVFALDRCTDDTRAVLDAAIAGDRRAHVLEIDACPPDWAGKVHALWRATRDVPAARDADILLFVDADTELHPECVRATTNLLRTRGAGLLSLISTMSSKAWFELIVQPAAGLELIRQYPLRRASDPDPARRRAFANGQFIMMTRAAYQAIGGHEHVRHALLEDVEIARRAAAANIPAQVMLAGTMHRCAMYGSWAEFRRGWERIYIESTNRKPARLRAFAGRVRVLGVWLPLAAAGALGLGLWAIRSGGDAHQDAAHIAAWLGGVSLTLMLAALTGVYAISRTPVWTAPLYPIGAWLTGAVMRRAARTLDRGGVTRWGGRDYTLTPR